MSDIRGAGGTYFLGRYRVVDEIGIGGMASVHLARMDGPGGFQKWVARRPPWAACWRRLRGALRNSRSHFLPRQQSQTTRRRAGNCPVGPQPPGLEW